MLKTERLAMDGILLVNKPKGLTSFRIVAILRKHFGVKKLGHGGTLDPFATGLLVLLFGKATKISSIFLQDDKEYKGVIAFGRETDTYDVTGKMVNENAGVAIDKEGLQKIFKQFEGSIEQMPPAYSAIKIDGKKAYELARKGHVVELNKRKVRIYNLKLSKLIRNTYFKAYFSTKVSKGTYIRSLAHDIGKKTGSGAYLEELERTASGRFSIDNAYRLDDILKWDAQKLRDNMISIDQANAKIEK